MPYALLLLGVLWLIAAINNKQGDLAELLKKDFSGDNNFWYWLASIGIIGGVGYQKDLREPSRYFIVLLFVVVFLSNRGFFSQFTSALSQVSSGTPSIKDVGAAQDTPKAANDNPPASDQSAPPEANAIQQGAGQPFQLPFGMKLF